MADNLLPPIEEQYQASLVLAVGTIEIMKERFIRELQDVTDLKTRANHRRIPAGEIAKTLVDALGSLASCSREVADSLQNLADDYREGLRQRLEVGGGESESTGSTEKNG